MKKLYSTFLSIAGLLLVTASSAFATATVTPANASISADCVGGVYSNLTGPVITEGATADVGAGTIVLSVAPGFEFNPAATVNVNTSRTGSGSSPLITLNSSTAAVTTNTITVTVAAPDGGTARTILTWTGIQARPTATSPLATNKMVLSTAGTAAYIGITKGTTNFGTLSETAGTAGTKLSFTTPPAATNVAGTSMANIIVQVQGATGNNVASNNVAVTLALNTGSFASGSTNATTGVNGAATFSNLVINTQGSYTVTASAPATTLSNSPAAPFVVVAGPPSTFQFTQDAPSSILAGTTFPSPVTVQLIDAFGNLISNKTVTLSLLGGGTLSGATSQASDGTGVATFAGLSVAQAGTNKALVASISSPSMSITGATFTVTAGSATKLGYTTAPAASTPAGVTMAGIVVQIQDAAGNAIASNGVPITVALNAGAFTSGTTTIVTGPDGSATFSDLLINVSGNYTLTASSAGDIFTATAPAPFTIATATPSVIQITQDAPSVATAGTVFSPSVTVLITDSLNNPATNTLVSLSLLGGGSLSGTVSHVTDVSGVATFNNLSISLAGTNYALVANSVNSLSATGNTFTVTVATASKLVYTSVPAITNVAGSTLSNFVVQVQDPFNNNVPGSGVPIAMSLANGTFASGTTNLNTDANGSATINDLVVTNAGNNTVTASSAGLTSANKSLVILPAPFSMTFQQDAPSLTNAGAVFSPAVAVKIVDQFNNALTNRPVTLTLLNGGTLGGTTVRTTDISGLAMFTNLFINVAGTNYNLLASATNSMSVTGVTFVVTPAAASKLAFTGVPAVTNVAGSPLTNFVMQVQDQFNNSVSTNGVAITMTLSNGTFASGTTVTNTDPTGSATIPDLVITNAGNNRVTASAAGLTSTNKTLVIVPAQFTMTFQQDAPAVTNAGAVFTPSVTVKIADQYSNFLTNRPVTMSLLNGTVFGTLVRTTAVNGVATFNDLNVHVPGTNYALIASSTNSMSVTGQTITVTVGAPSKLMYTVLPPSTVTAGATLSTFVVQVEDQFSNFISTGGIPITLALNTGSFASGTTNTVTDPDGSSTFFDVVINNAGTYTMTANSPGLTAAGRVVTVVPDVASNLSFVQQPPAVTNAGAVFTPSVTVKVTDPFNNPVGSMNVIVSLNGPGTLGGTLTRATATNGIATFNNLSVNLPGTGDFLTASTTSPALSTNSANFNINVGPLDHYLVTATPPLLRGSNFTVTVTAQDVASNTVPDSSTVVTMSSPSINVLFDGTGDNSFTNNTQVLSNGSFTITTIDDLAETTTITATSAGSKTGSAAITVNSAGGDYRSAANGNWSVASTWQVWDGANWVAASTPPAGGVGTNITIQSTHTVTNNAALSLMGRLTTQGSLSFTASGTITVGTGGIVRNSGTINSTANSLIFNSGGLYRHAYTNAVGTVPTSTWNSNSTCAIIGYTTASGNPGGFTQNFYNFVWNCPNQSAAVSAGGALTTVNGDFTVVSTGSGSFQGGNTGVLALTVGGNVNLQGGAFLGSVSGAGNVVKIGGSYVQTGGTFSQGSGELVLNFTGANKNFIRSGGTINNVNINYAVTNGASLALGNSLSVSNGQTFTVFGTGTLNCGTNVISGAGAFALNSGGALGIGSTDGIASSGATGNVQTTTRTFNTGGVYIYNGSASQATGSGLPATASSLIVSNTGGIVTLGANVSVTSNLTVSAGVFDLGGFTANRASNGGTVTVASSAALKIGGANTFPTNYLNRVLAGSTVEYEGTAQSMPALAYGNLTTSGSGIKTLLAGATSIDGDLNIGVGTTFNAVTNSFTLAGNLTNNGSAYSFSGPQIVTFTGSGTQNVAGASSTAFNTFAIGSNTVINLANNNTALEFTIAGLDQAGGTWGSTASGAANPDDANFLGNGTLDVTPPTFGISFLQDAPAVTNAGAVFSPPVTVQLTSTATNLIINKMVTLTLNGGTLNGTLSQLTDTNGVATFPNLSINVAGASYSLTATITNPVLSVTGNVFTVTSAAATKLVYSSFPAITNAAGGTLSAFTVQIADQFNNNVANSGVAITMNLATGTFASGTPVMNSDVNGTATFSDLVITNAGNNTLTASSPGLASANRALVILPTPYTMTLQQDAPAVTNAGAVFTPAVTVKIADQFNNVLSNATVTMSLLNGGTLNGTLSRTTANTGVATFNNLSINIPGTNYALVAVNAANSLSVTGNTFTVTTAPASKLIYTTLPVATNTAGQTLPTFVVQVADSFNNPIATNGVPITMTLNSGTFASGTPSTITDPDGSSTFFDLVITNAGSRILTASAPGLTSINQTITILPDVVNSTMTFVQEPAASIGAGSVFTNTVQIVDEFSNGISSASVTLTPNGFTFSGGTLTRTTAANGVATFNNLSVNTPGSNYFITATSGSLTATSSTFNVTVGAIARYVVDASSPQTHDVPFLVTVTAVDAASNTVVADSSTVVTLSGSAATVQFDANGDTNFVDNTQTLSNGTFTISTRDVVAETITITASDANGKTGTSSAITVTAAGGDYRSIINGLWNNPTTWQVWDGANWVSTNATPAGGAGTNITIQGGGIRAVTNNVAITLSGTLINQGTLAFTSGSIAVGSGGLVQNSGSIVSSATTLLFNSGGTYQHAQNGGTIPTAAFNSNSLLRVTGITSTITALPTSIGGNVEWNCPNQTTAAAIILSAATTIGGDFNVVSTGSGSIIDGGTTARNLSVGGNVNVQGGTYFAIGGNGSSAGNVTVSVAHDLSVSGGNFSMVVGQGGTSSFNVSGTLIVGGNLAMTGGTLAILTNTTYNLSGVSSMTVSGNTSIAGGLLNLTSATSGNASGVSANLRGDLSISGGTISRGGSLPATVNFAGTNTQTYSKSGGIISGAVNFAILPGATVYFGTSLLDGSTGTFTLNAGGRIGLGDPAGITTSGPTGNIQVTGTRTYSTAGRYVYNGSAPQDTGNGLPATVSSLTCSNIGATVTLDATVNVTSNLTVTAGTFDMGSFTADRITSGGTITVATGAALKIGGTNTFPANYLNRAIGTGSTVEYEGSAQNVSALPYGNLRTSGSSTKSLQAGATAIAGGLTIGSGTTFDAGTNDFSIAGDWSNNGSFAASGTQTVTFNGVSPQNVDNGTSATTFNNVAISAGSVLNLAFTGSDIVQLLTIAGTPETTGTWGATGSGAAHVDDAHFQGTTGTLNVTAQIGVPSSTALISSANPQTYGQPVTFTATVTGTGPVPTGTVTFMDGANTMGTSALDGGGQGNFITNTLPAGLHLITAVYGGDVNFNGSTSVVLSQQITQVGLTVSGITANNKTYDGGTNATLNTGGATLVTVIGSDNVTLNTGSAVGFFTDKNVAGGKTVNVSGLTISGPDSGNYTLTQPTTSASIFALGISVTAAPNTKTYDGLTNAAALPTVTSNSLQGVDISAFSEIYDNKNVGTGKTLTPSGTVIDGNSGLNYVITFLTSTTGVINPRSLTVSATGVDKVYDGGTNATVNLSDDRLSGDVFSDTYTTAYFADPNVGSNKTVTVNGIGISGIDATNYTPNATASTTANITLGSLTISADNKAKTAGLPNPPLTATYSGFAVGDGTNNALSTQVTLSTTADTNSPVGTYPITASGAVAPNYTISYNGGTLTVFAVPQLSTLSISGNQFIFSYPTLSGQLYQVEYKDDMAAPTWNNMGSPIPGNGSSIIATNAISGPKRFFRIDVTPGQ